MWILPSRGRPQNVIRLIEAFNRTGATTPVWLRLDDDDPQPEFHGGNWIINTGPRLPLSEIYAEAYRKYPDLPWYGFIADDVVPKTNGWDTALIEAAGENGMAVPGGGHDPEGAPHFVLGGDLVREIGWLSLPGLDRLYIDTVWQLICERRGVMVRRNDVVLEHRHFSNGKALMDSTYRKHRKLQDKEVFETWRQQNGYLS
jgi:hypothetical protein